MAFCYKSLLLFYAVAIAISFVAAKHIRRTSQQSSDILPEGFIGGGAPVRVGQFPWMVRLDIYKNGTLYLCGGSLINDRHVLSALHCFIGVQNYTDISITLGEYNSDTFPRDCVEGQCTDNIKLHPDNLYWTKHFNMTTYANDIVVLRLEKRVQLSDTIQPIALPTFDPEDTYFGVVGPSVVIAGWGRDEHGNISRVLLSTEVDLINRTICLAVDRNMPEKHFCAGRPNGNSMCPGDSGGPLMMFRENKYYLAGIVSYMKNPKCPVDVGYYTNVYKYMGFIEKALNISRSEE